MSKYLVTGGAGFIGTNICKQLVADGHGVFVIDNYAGGRHADRAIEGVNYIEGDIRNVVDLDHAIGDGVDGIFHLAALPRVPFSVAEPELTHDVNVNGTLQVLVAARRHKIKRVVFSSSSSTYGNQEVFPLVEDIMIKKPISPYAMHKYIGEHYCRLWSELYGVEAVSLIYFNVYGPYFDPEGPYALVIGRFLKQRKNNEPMTVYGDGEYYRDYTHVKDIVRANILAMTSQKVGKGETINIGNNNPYSVNKLTELIGGPTVFMPDRPGDVRYTRADITKARELLGWEPTVELEDGIMELKKDWGVE